MSIRTKAFRLERGAMIAATYRLTLPVLLIFNALLLAFGFMVSLILSSFAVPGPIWLGPVLMLFPVVVLFLQPKNTVIEAMKSPLMTRLQTVEIAGDRLLVHRQGVISTNLPLTDLWKVRKIPEGLAIYLTPGSWLFVPKDAFASADDYEAAYSELSARIQPQQAGQDWILEQDQ